MADTAITYTWQWVEATDEDGVIRRCRAMVPLKRYDNIAARQFEENQLYTLVVQQFRSLRSHRYYFASIKDGFDNMPENIAARWPSPEHLRKWLLVECGFFDEKEFDFEGRDAKVQARKLGLFIRTEDEYATITTRTIDPTHCKVIVRRAKSQAMEGPQAMSVEEFKASSRAVLETLEHMIGVARGTLKKEAQKHG